MSRFLNPDFLKTRLTGFRDSPLPLLLRTIVGIAILATLFFFIEPRTILQTFLSADLRFLLVALMLLPLNIGLQVIKWKVLLNSFDKNIAFTETTRSIMHGLVLGSITPAHIGEFAGRLIVLKKIPRSVIVGLTLLDKLQIMAVFAFFGIMSSMYFLGARSWQVQVVTVVIAFPFLVVAAKPDILAKILNRFRFLGKERPWYDEFLGSLTILKGKLFVVTFVFTFLFYGVLYLQFYFLLNAFFQTFLWQVFLGFSAMMFYKSLVPISIGDIGVREATSIFFLSLVGVPQEAAFSASLLLAIINVFLPAIIGLGFSTKEIEKAGMS